MPAKLTQPAAPEYFGKSAAATYLGVSIDTIDRRIADVQHRIFPGKVFIRTKQEQTRSPEKRGHVAAVAQER